MKFVQEIEKLQKENEGSIILAKNGIFFVAIGKDAITLQDELEEIYRYKGKNTGETKSCLECTSCANRKEQEEDILERVRNLGKAK